MKRLILIAMVVLMSSSITMAQEFCKGDFDYDGDVDADDVEEFLNHFGRSSSITPVQLMGLHQWRRRGRRHVMIYLDGSGWRATKRCCIGNTEVYVTMGRDGN